MPDDWWSTGGSSATTGAADAPDDWWAASARTEAGARPAADPVAARAVTGADPVAPIVTVGNGGHGRGGSSGGGYGGGSRRPPKPRSPRRRGRRKRLFQRRSRRRRIMIWSLLGLGALLVVFGLLVVDGYHKAYGIYGTLKEVPPLVSKARSQLEVGQLPTQQLETASGLVGEAQVQIAEAGLPFRFVRSLPLLGRPIKALELATDAASREAQAATIVNGLIQQILGPDPGGPGPAPVFDDGVIDVDLLHSVTPQLQRVVTELRAADASVRAIPSIPFVSQLDTLKAEVLGESSKAIVLSQRALDAVHLLPNFLGADGPKEYYLALQNNDDQRGTGGAVLSFAVVRIDHGHLSLVRSGTISDIDSRSGGGFFVKAPSSTAWYMNNTGAARRLANGANYSPDFPSAGQTWTAMLSKAIGSQVDGVIALDPYAVAGAMTGEDPIEVPGLPEPVTSENLVPFVMHDQYLLSKTLQNAVPAILIHSAYEAIASPNHLFGLMHQLSTSLAEKHVQIWSAEPQVQALVSRLGWGGAIANPAGGDYVNLAYAKRIGNKVDYFAKLNTSYDVTVLPTGGVRSTYDVGLSLDDMPSGLPDAIAGQALPYGADVAMFNLYVPGSARFASVDPSGDFPTDVVTVPNGSERDPIAHIEPRGFVQHVETVAGGSFRVLTQTIVVWPGHPGSVQYRYSVPGVVKQTPAGKVYTLTVQHQPLVNPQHLRVVLHLPKGASVVSLPPGWIANPDAGTVVFQGDVTSDFTTSVVFR